MDKRTSYLMGNKIEHTGRTFFAHGEEWGVWVYLEGHKKGEEAHTPVGHWLHR